MEEPTKGVKKEARKARINANDRVSFIMISGSKEENSLISLLNEKNLILNYLLVLYLINYFS